MRELFKESHVNGSNKQSTTFSNGRRVLLGGMAALGAGLVGSASVPRDLTTRSSEGTPSKPQAAAVPCAQNKVIRSDSTTVVETSAGKVRGFERNGVYIFKGIPYGASTSGPRRFMSASKPEPCTGIRNALAYERVCPQQDSAHLEIGRHIELSPKQP